MDMKARTSSEPGLYARMSVRTVVVDDQVHIEVLWNVLVDVMQKAQKPLVSMPCLALGEDLAVAGASRRGSPLLRDRVIAEDYGVRPLSARRRAMIDRPILR